jgi:hypothetical protein
VSCSIDGARLTRGRLAFCSLAEAPNRRRQGELGPAFPSFSLQRGSVDASHLTSYIYENHSTKVPHEVMMECLPPPGTLSPCLTNRNLAHAGCCRFAPENEKVARGMSYPSKISDCRFPSDLSASTFISPFHNSSNHHLHLVGNSHTPKIKASPPACFVVRVE